MDADIKNIIEKLIPVISALLGAIIGALGTIIIEAEFEAIL